MGCFGSIIGGHGRWEERREREEISFLKVWKRRGCEGKTSSSIHLLVFLPSSVFHNVLPLPSTSTASLQCLDGTQSQRKGANSCPSNYRIFSLLLFNLNSSPITTSRTYYEFVKKIQRENVRKSMSSMREI